MKDKKFILIVYIFVMALIFIVSATNLVIDENYKKVYDISIIFDDEDNGKYKKLEMGIEDSTFDLFVDINFVYLENTSNIEEQKKAILGEVNSGVDGLIIIPVNEKALDSFLDKSNIKIPIITLDKELASRKVYGVVKADYSEMGEKIGKNIYNFQTDKEIVAFTEVGSINSEMFNAIKTTLEGHGKTCKVVYYSSDNFNEKVEDFDIENTVFISLTTNTTELFIKQYIENAEFDEKLTLYGFGYRNKSLYYLNKGDIETLSLFDEYMMGYLGVQNLIYSIEGKPISKQEIIPNYIIGKQDVYKYEKILFPRD